MNCSVCSGKCYRRGSRKGNVRYSCTACGLWQQADYQGKRITKSICDSILLYHCDSMGISDIARTLQLGKSTIVKWIKKLAELLPTPKVRETNQEYEVDEIYTCVGQKRCQCWIAYAMNRHTHTREVVGYVVGRRTTENLKRLINPLLLLHPKVIRTDKLLQYQRLIPAELHKFTHKCTNRIERNNLTIRTHLKRLTRKSLCYTKSSAMLTASLKLYMLNKSGINARYYATFGW